MRLAAALADECRFMFFRRIVLRAATVHFRSHRHRVKRFPAKVHGHYRMRSDKQHDQKEKYGYDSFHFEETVIFNHKCIYII